MGTSLATVMRLTAAACVLAVAGLGTGGCAGGSEQTDDIVGNWLAEDGSVKTIDGTGACTGMYFDNGRPLDIGGPMRCTFSEETGENDRHVMVVTQGSNQQTLRLEFLAPDAVMVFDGYGRRIAKLARM